MNVSLVWKRLLAHRLPLWRERRVVLVLDCPPVDDRATIVYIGLLVYARVLSLAWQSMPAQEHWPEGQWVVVKRLLDQIAPHLEQAGCALLADRGLVGWALVQLCCQYHWHALLRVRREHTRSRAGWDGGRPGDRSDR